MFNEKSIKIYNYIVGAVCFAVLLIVTVVYGMNIGNLGILLFFILIAIEIVIDRFRIYTSKLWISFVSIIELSSFLILGVTASAWIQLIFIFITDYIIYRKPFRTVSLNIGMITGKMFVGAIAYYQAVYIIGGSNGLFFSAKMLLPAIAFTFSGALLNYVFLYIQLYMVNNKISKKIITESAIWETVSILISIPVALEFTDIYKYSSGHNLLFAVLFLMPIVFVCFIFSLVRSIMFANTQLKALSKVALTINSYLDLEETYNSILDAISSLVGFNGCYIFDIDESGIEMMPVAYRMDENTDDRICSFDVKKSVLGRVTGSSQAIIINDLAKEYGNYTDNELSILYKSCILVPMRRLNKCVGCIGIFSNELRAYNRDILEFLMILADQAAIAIENAKLFKLSEEEAITDSLTFLYNQRYFYNYINSKIKESSWTSSKLSLILFDIDYFKRVNDSYGHLTGDYVLKEVAHLIKNSVRKNDVVARYGGEEFTVILPDLDSEGSYVIAERIREKIENHIFKANGFDIRITISGGISEYPKIASNSIELVSYADRAMYVGAKFKGRNKIKIYDEKLA